jgi:hypothetical protein
MFRLMIQYVKVAFLSFNSVTHLFTVITISRALCSGVCFISGSSFFGWFLWPRLTILISDLIAPHPQIVSDISHRTTEDIGSAIDGLACHCYPYRVFACYSRADVPACAPAFAEVKTRRTTALHEGIENWHSA